MAQEFMPVKDLNHYSALIKENNARHADRVTNCFLMPQEIAELTQKGLLSYRVCAAGRLFFLDCGVYDRLYFFVSPQHPIGSIDKDKPVVREFVQSQLRPADEKAELIKARWREAGFTHNTTTLRMRRREAGMHNNAQALSPVAGISVAQAGEAELDDVAAVWRASFDPLVNLLPSDAEQHAAMQAGELYCAIDDETGQVVGAAQFRFTKSTGYIWHIAVLPAFRNRHIGQALTRHYFYLAQLRQISNHLLWVVESNQGAIRFHQRNGYQFDGTYSQQYLLHHYK